MRPLPSGRNGVEPGTPIVEIPGMRGMMKPQKAPELLDKSARMRMNRAEFEAVIKELD